MFKTLIYNGIEYPNYEIDETGAIRNRKTNHIYKHTIGAKGYLLVTLPMGKRGCVKGIRVHKAVAETFIPNPNNYPIVNHLDENKLNSNISNLEWTTHKGNTQAHLKMCNEKGETFNNRKLAYKDVEFIRASKGKIGQGTLAKMFNVSKVTISNAQRGLLYANGY